MAHLGLPVYPPLPLFFLLAKHDLGFLLPLTQWLPLCFLWL